MTKRATKQKATAKSEAKGRPAGGRKPPEPDAAPPVAPPRLAGPEARAEAMRRLALGQTMQSVAAALGVHRHTVAEWRASPEGRAELEAARAQREAAFGDVLAEGKRALRELVPLAIDTLAQGMDSGVPFEAITAAQAILDRTGLPKSTVVEAPKRARPDLSKLSPDELRQLKKLHQKLRGESGGSEGGA